MLGAVKGAGNKGLQQQQQKYSPRWWRSAAEGADTIYNYADRILGFDT
jgi:hypothetical protein